MKKRMILTGIISQTAIAVMLVFGMVLAGCDNGSTDDIFAGTWEGVAYGDSPLALSDGATQIRVVAANGSFTAYATCTYPNVVDFEYGRGTYTVSGSTATVTLNESVTVVRTDDNGDLIQWAWPRSNLSQTVTLTGNSFTFFGSTFTKPVSGAPGTPGSPGLYRGTDTSPQANTGALFLALAWLKTKTV
ncbi:hypothetical protein AGMMS49991_09030 [Spirochaetia bacterium]|nr:hypothetical protein AGMMS49991_09030 [Spirochaetia bacterium]